MKRDIGEQNDLSADETEIAIKLLDKLKKWTEKVNAPIPHVLNK